SSSKTFTRAKQDQEGVDQPSTKLKPTLDQPFTRSQLRDIRMGLKNGASLESIANALQFNPLLLENIPNTVGDMVIDKNLPARDRISAAKTFAMFVSQRMEQEKRDQQIPDRVEVNGAVAVEVVEALVTTRAEASAILKLEHERNGETNGAA